MRRRKNDGTEINMPFESGIQKKKDSSKKISYVPVYIQWTYRPVYEFEWIDCRRSEWWKIAFFSLSFLHYPNGITFNNTFCATCSFVFFFFSLLLSLIHSPFHTFSMCMCVPFIMEPTEVKRRAKTNNNNNIKQRVIGSGSIYVWKKFFLNGFRAFFALLPSFSFYMYCKRSYFWL